MVPSLRNWLFLYVLAMLLAVGPASALVVWDEAVDGDLATNLGLQVVVETGTNVIRGTATDRVGLPTDSDQFLFQIPTGAELLSASYSYSLADFEAGTTTLHTGLGIGDLNTYGVLSPFQLIRIIDGGVVVPSGTFGLSFNYTPLAGYYRFDNTASARSADGGGSWDWEVTLEVGSSVVPLPAAAWLFGSALSCLAGWSLSRARSSV
ncbi:MAG: hypothetical protein KJO38_04520 [Gammaproteobacteria bacterium]|nr:hypothetical protein [Gammaproteobacteria bacterium]